MGNGYVGVLSHPGCPLAAEGTLKTNNPCQKKGQNSPEILLNFATLKRKKIFEVCQKQLN